MCALIKLKSGATIDFVAVTILRIEPLILCPVKKEEAPASEGLIKEGFVESLVDPAFSRSSLEQSEEPDFSSSDLTLKDDSIKNFGVWQKLHMI